ncbi:hypothetical protein CQW23_26749 [Capsicum baccatum]|uniref:Uncharacterized protein n=1 Tax=Capsicum baccatum TaxID=33114 RepID=A0A2G2VPP3_CAPBA|nr:hypothetical protein CQW23_26749 [Capsicum baccatum]
MVLQNKSDGCKYTLVKTAYNLNFDKFDGSNFLADVNKALERHNGLVSLQNEMEEILDHLRRIKSGGDLDSFKIDQIEKLTMDLRLLRTFVKDVAKVHHKHEILKDFRRRTINFAYEDEVSIDSILLFLLSIMCFVTFFSLPIILKEIKQINAEVTVMWSADVALKPHYVVEPSKHLPSQHSNPVSNNDEIVGFDIATKKLIRHLTRGTSELDVIPTIGMGEQGKMTFVRKGWYEQGIFSTFLSRNKIPSWFTKLVVRSILKENLFEDYYVQTAGSEGGVEEEDDDDDSIIDYDDDDDEDEEATLAEIEEFFGDLC